MTSDSYAGFGKHLFSRMNSMVVYPQAMLFRSAEARLMALFSILP